MSTSTLRRAVLPILSAVIVFWSAAALPSCASEKKGEATAPAAPGTPTTATAGPTAPTSPRATTRTTSASSAATTTSSAEAAFIDEVGDLSMPKVLASLSADARAYQAHITTLANPFFEGRSPDTNGNRVAADYVEFWFKEAGLKPAFPDAEETAAAGMSPAQTPWNSYRQPFSMPGGRTATTQELSVTAADGATFTFTAGTEFNAMGTGGGTASGPLSFVGYAIDAGPQGFETYGSFGEIDLTGRIAVLLRFEPSGADGFSKWRSAGQEGWSGAASISDKMLQTARRGAAGIIMVHPPGTHDWRTNELLTADESTWGRVNIPVVHMSIPAAEKLLTATDGRSLAEFKALADADDAKAFHLKDGVTVSINTKLERKEDWTDNVGGILRGKGALADQWIIIGAHYDHVGYGYFGSGSGSVGMIHPGADDNGSGTCGVLVLADRLAKVYRDMPEDAEARSILFMAFSAEESGLNGSRFYTRHPTLTADAIDLMINMDMIGRLRLNDIEISGMGTAEEMAEIVQPHVDRSGLKVSYQQTGQGPSDHASFYAVQIPVLFFFTGLHDVYHTPNDVASTINSVGAIKVIDFVQSVAMDLATRQEKLVFTPASGGFSRNALLDRIEAERRGETPNLPSAAEAAAGAGAGDAAPPDVPAPPRVRLGIQPSYEEGVEGVKVDDVFEGTTAADGGLKAGDRITTWNDVKLTSVADLMSNLRKQAPGDKVKINVVRDGKTIELTLTMKGREEGG